MSAFRHLTQDDIVQVCAIIKAWPLPTITWEAVCREVGIHLKHQFTRQALERKPEIKATYLARRGRRENLVEKDHAERKIANLQARVEELEKALAEYDLRFLRHIERAIRWDKLPQDLEKPLDKEIPLLRSDS
ncbi:hypothetical protein [Geothrix edaphica]|uniref:Transposase n=1 Tax=Geothrix edaphica TaxID=2927976 RepID=A0ABQ5Q0S4_9BACT|nr:hypothetical protein [Geothrix edaphica]GLH68232.1 hypothetical protein GETHED_25960 [Geothrix edaphica]